MSFLLRSASGFGKADFSRSKRPTSEELEAMLIYSMSVSVDGFIADRDGAIGSTVPDEELFRVHPARLSEPTPETPTATCKGTSRRVRVRGAAVITGASLTPRRPRRGGDRRVPAASPGPGSGSPAAAATSGQV